MDTDMTKEQAAEKAMRRMAEETDERRQRATRINKSNRRWGAVAAVLGLLLIAWSLATVAMESQGAGILLFLGVLLLVLGAYYLGKRVKPEDAL